MATNTKVTNKMATNTKVTNKITKVTRWLQTLK